MNGRKLTRIGAILIDLETVVAMFPHQRSPWQVVDSVGTIFFESGQTMQVPKSAYLGIAERLAEAGRVDGVEEEGEGE